MTERQQQHADELHDFLTAKLTGQPFTPSEAFPQAEAELGAELLELAAATEPEPAFLADLEVQLQRKAQQSQAVQPAQRPATQTPPFWQTWVASLQEAFTVRRTVFALTTVAALFLFILFAWPLLRDMMQRPGVPVADLPYLPPLDPNQVAANSAPLMGVGAGGDVAALQSEQAEPPDIFAGVTFTLNAPLPEAPAEAIVEQRAPLTITDVETARSLAGQFGFTGPLYTESFGDIPAQPSLPESTPGSAPSPPPRYLAFNGSQTLTLFGNEVIYMDRDANFQLGAFPAAVEPVAEAFLQERGLLPFAYAMESDGNGNVYFYRLINGRLAMQPRYWIQVDQTGKVVLVRTMPYAPEPQLQQTYPLRSAAAAWTLIQEGVTANDIPYALVPERFTGTAVELPAPAAVPQYWTRTYQPGSEIHIYGMPQVYLPLNEAEVPLVRLLNFSLQADEETMRTLAQQVAQPLHVWGHLAEDGETVQVAGWELSPIQPLSIEGHVQQTAEQTLLVASSGETFIIPDAPADLSDGLQVNISVAAIRDAGAAYRLLEWHSINEAVAPEAAMPQPAAPPPFTDPNDFDAVSIDQVELVYYVMQLRDDTGVMPSPFMASDTMLQPAWKFSGRTSNGDKIEFFVQAIAPEYVGAE